MRQLAGMAIVFVLLFSVGLARAADDWVVQQTEHPFSVTLTAEGDGESSMVARCDDENVTLSLVLADQSSVASNANAGLIFESKDAGWSATVAVAERIDDQTFAVTVSHRSNVRGNLDVMWRAKGPFVLTGVSQQDSALQYGSEGFSSAGQRATIKKFADACDLMRNFVTVEPPFQE